MKTTFLEVFDQLAHEAGLAIMDIRSRGFEVVQKSDASPVTQADKAAEAIILKGLRAEFPDIPVVAEEETSEGLTEAFSTDAPFFLVDPLDGTREFATGGEDFTVNIALIEDRRPTTGLIHVPVQDITYAGNSLEAWKRIGPGKKTALNPGTKGDPVRVVASKSHRTPETDAWINTLGPHSIVSIGSSLKFCLLAEGKADVYPRFGRTMEWDTAAGDAILRAVGGVTQTLEARPLGYGKPAHTDSAFANPHFISFARNSEAGAGNPKRNAN